MMQCQDYLISPELESRFEFWLKNSRLLEFWLQRAFGINNALFLDASLTFD